MKKLILITLILLGFLSTFMSCKKESQEIISIQKPKTYFYVAEVSNSGDTVSKSEIIVNSQ